MGVPPGGAYRADRWQPLAILTDASMNEISSNSPARGSCVGYEIRSLMPFTTLRAGGGTPLYVEESSGQPFVGDVVATWEPRPGNPFHGRLLQDGTRYGFWASDAGWYVIDPEAPSVSVPSGADPVRREVRLFGVPTAVCAFAQGDISIHASAVQVHGEGVVLAGPSKFGKTTLAAAFARAGHRLLTEDTTRCDVSDPPSIYPGPAVLRLRSDVAEWLHIPGARAAWAEDGRAPLIIDEQLRGDGHRVPLRAILFLGNGTGPPELRPLPTTEALRDVFALAFRLPSAESRAACFDRVTDLVGRVETLTLHRQMTMESLEEVVALVERHLGTDR